MKPLRIAIVGAGLMGRWHSLEATRCGSQVVAVVDTNPAAAAGLISHHGAAVAYSDLLTCLAQGGIEIVHVCTPTSTHSVLAEIALSTGVHVLVEKPMASTLAETRRLLEVSRDHHVKINPVLQFPFQRGVRQAVQEIGHLGDLLRVSFRACSAGGEERDGMARRTILREIAPHSWSLFRALGRPLPACADWHIQQFTEHDLSYSGIAEDVTFETHISLRGRPPRNELVLLGTRATVIVDLFHGYQVRETSPLGRWGKLQRPFGFGSKLIAAAGLNLARRAMIGQFAYPGLREFISEFYRAVRDDDTPPFSPAEMLEVAEFLERIAPL